MKQVQDLTLSLLRGLRHVHHCQLLGYPFQQHLEKGGGSDAARAADDRYFQGPLLEVRRVILSEPDNGAKSSPVWSGRSTI
jgi:hypothetical protein